MKTLTDAHEVQESIAYWNMNIRCSSLDFLRKESMRLS